MKDSSLKAIPKDVESLIVEVRGRRVILDSDLAAIYGVPTRRLNEQVKRNVQRFPEDFLFRLAAQEVQHCRLAGSRFGAAAGRGSKGGLAEVSGLPRTPINLKSQIATSSSKHGGHRKLPWAFTEHGSIMAANILHSRRGADMSVFVVRAFVKMRSAFTDTQELARKLASLEQELKARLDSHEAAIVEVLHRIMRILDPAPPPPEPPPPEIGFHVREEPTPYRVHEQRPNPGSQKPRS
jgi:hypothetical protein